MAKYSTGGGAGGSGGQTCELCGEAADDLRVATVAGAELQVCGDCAPHDDTSRQGGGASSSDSDGGGRSDSERRANAAQNQAKAFDAATGDSTRWEEEGTDYERDQLPYLVSDYGAKVVKARQDAGLQREELAEELSVDESDLLAVEQGRATRAGVGGSVIAKLEDRLDIELADE
ncbi:MAG: multiprotein-bridging factor 1 family protein [Halobacteriaceae archaeon]